MPRSRLRFSGPSGRLIKFVIWSLALGLLAYLYSQQEIRGHFEDYLFDLRTRMKPKHSVIADPVIISMNKATIPTLERRLGLSELSTEELFSRAVHLLAQPRFQIKHRVLLLFPNVFDYQSERMQELRDLILGPGVAPGSWFIGTLGYHAATPFLRPFPESLGGGLPVYSLDTGRKRSNAVVRQVPMSNFRADVEQPTLGFALVRQTVDLTEISRQSIFLNFEPRQAFTTIKAEDLLAAPGRFINILRGKTVLVGFTDFRRWPFQTYEKTTANTPLMSHPTDGNKRESIAYITANTLENLIHQRYLQPVNGWWQMVHVVFVSLLTWIFWHRSPLQGAIWVFLGFPVLVYMNSLAMGFYGVYIPLADTVALSVVGMVMGAFTSLERNLGRLADERASAQAGAEMAQLQSRLLDSFTEELSNLTLGILSKVRLLQLPPGTAVRIEDVLQRFRKSLEEFADYITDIAYFSNLMNKHDRRPKLVEFPLRPLVQKVVGRFPQKQLAQTNILVNLPDGLMVRSSAEIVDTILFNLVGNALKYAGDSETISVGAKAAGGFLCLFVEDQGPGIAPEFQDRIFEKFYRIKDDQVYEKKGTGLGLYLCRYFAEKIGGTITLDSKLGQGARFSLNLPS